MTDTKDKDSVLHALGALALKAFVNKDDIDMLVDDPEGPSYYFCCRNAISFRRNIVAHRDNCWFRKLKSLIEDHDKLSAG